MRTNRVKEWAICYKGGGSTGKVDYPGYMKDVHAVWIGGKLSKDLDAVAEILPSASLPANTLGRDLYEAKAVNPYTFIAESEELVTNGSFNDGAAASLDGWQTSPTEDGTDWEAQEVDTGSFAITHLADDAMLTKLYQQIARISASSTYKLVYTLSYTGGSGSLAGSVTPYLGGIKGTTRTKAGTYTEYLVAPTKKTVTNTTGNNIGIPTYSTMTEKYNIERTTYLCYPANQRSRLLQQYGYDDKGFLTVIKHPVGNLTVGFEFPSYEKWLTYQPQALQPAKVPATDVRTVDVTWNLLEFDPSSDFNGSLTAISLVLSEEVMNPNAVAYDPDEQLAYMQNAVDEQRLLLEDANPQRDWISALSLANAQKNTEGLFSINEVNQKVADISSNAMTEAIEAVTLYGDNATERVDNIIAKASNTATKYLSTLPEIAMEAAAETLKNPALADAVDTFERLARRKHNERIRRFASGMADVNSVMSSAFVMGMAMLERDFIAEIMDYEAKELLLQFRQSYASFLEYHIRFLSQNIEAYRAEATTALETFARLFESNLRTHFMERQAQQQFVNEGISSMVRNMQAQIDRGQAVANLQTEVSRMSIVAKSEEQKNNLEIDAHEALWDLELWKYGANMLSAQHGGGGMGGDARKPNPIASALGGALSGAATGATIATAISTGAAAGPIGAGIGALIGIAGGLLE